MKVAADAVLNKLKEMQALSYKSNPDIGIDSLALALNIEVPELIPVLIDLETEDLITINIKTTESTRARSLISSGRVRLNEKV